MCTERPRKCLIAGGSTTVAVGLLGIPDLDDDGVFLVSEQAA
jgi:hypothetical protein